MDRFFKYIGELKKDMWINKLKITVFLSHFSAFLTTGFQEGLLRIIEFSFCFFFFFFYLYNHVNGCK